MADKEKTEKTRWGALLTTISEVCKAVAIPVLAVGSGFLFITLAGYSTMPMLVPIAVLSATLALVATAVGAGYVASAYKQQEETEKAQSQAQSIAHHVAQELQDPSRADGKNWSQVTQTPEQTEHLRG